MIFTGTHTGTQTLRLKTTSHSANKKKNGVKCSYWQAKVFRIMPEVNCAHFSQCSGTHGHTQGHVVFYIFARHLFAQTVLSHMQVNVTVHLFTFEANRSQPTKHIIASLTHNYYLFHSDHFFTLRITFPPLLLLLLLLLNFNADLHVRVKPWTLWSRTHPKSSRWYA